MVSFAGACFAIRKRIWSGFVGGGTFWREASLESWFPVVDIGQCLVQFNRLLCFQELMHIKEKEVVDEACRGGDNDRRAGNSVSITTISRKGGGRMPSIWR